MVNSDEYAATMIAVAPGLVTCVLLSLLFDWPGLPGIFLSSVTAVGCLMLARRSRIRDTVG
ncbi:MAG: hypothetical protein JSS49_18840 [Planctomycetes bacterium]|nr:hypothetical protein [Planctomycetota bacterium]